MGGRARDRCGRYRERHRQRSRGKKERNATTQQGRKKKAQLFFITFGSISITTTNIMLWFRFSFHHPSKRPTHPPNHPPSSPPSSNPSSANTSDSHGKEGRFTATFRRLRPRAFFFSSCSSCIRVNCDCVGNAPRTTMRSSFW